MTLMKFDASNVEPKLAARCREIIGVYTVEEVQAVSAGAATFYVWVSSQRPSDILTVLKGWFDLKPSSSCEYKGCIELTRRVGCIRTLDQ